jgi:signal transduction histidine kinase
MHIATTNGAAQSALLEDLRLALGRVVHDVNNPLAIISGNAQLLGELSRVCDFDGDVSKAIKDIEEASVELASQMSRLSALREEVCQATGIVTDSL